MKASTYRKRIIANMKSVGTYRSEFDKAIGEMANICEDMDAARERFREEGSEIIISYTNKNGSTNFVKNPLYLAIEGMQASILQYSRELGLTPAGLKKLSGENMKNGKEGASPFAKLLESMGSG